MKRLFSGVLLLTVFSAVPALSQQTATGYVFKDENGNNRMDKGEKGVPGIGVSNGIQVVKTDAKGRYQLPVGDDNVIFVVKPSGYKVPLNEDYLPRFYYVHQPQGSPEFKYKGVSPTGPLPKSVDFALIPQQEPDNFRFLVFGDPQVNDDTEIGYYKNDIVSEVKGVKDVAFGITMGDLVQENLNQHKDYKKVTSEVGIPWYNVIGNHDLNSDCEADSLNHETFKANFGPVDYSFNYGKLHVIILNDNIFPVSRGPRGRLKAGFRPYQLEFIENDLKLVDTGRLVVLAFHCPLKGIDDSTFEQPVRKRYFEILRRFPHVFSIAAHTHQLDQNFFGASEGWHGIQPYHELDAGATCGNWYSGKVNEKGFLDGLMSNGTPRGYLYLNVTGNQYTADYKVAGKPADYQIRLYHRKVLTPVWWDGRGSIYANFFMGYKDAKVECRIDDRPWKPMKYSVEHDPYFLAQNTMWDEADTLFKGRRPTEGADCKHLWTAPLPCNIGVGTHQIEVRATDMFGRTFVQKSAYRIEEPR